MKYLKRFNESNDNKYILISYNKIVNRYPESTGIIIDSNNNIVDNIDLLFTMGEYSEEAKSKFEKYDISGKTIGPDKDHYFVSNDNDISKEEALKKYMSQVDISKRADKFLTPEKQDELINLFKKKK